MAVADRSGIRAPLQRKRSVTEMDRMEKNWIKTIPGEGWFTLLRLYAPLEPILDRTWRPNDIELVK